MKNILLAVLILITGALQANAQVLTATEIKTNVTKQITTDYKKYTDAELQVEILNMPFAELHVADGKISYKVISNTDRFMPRDVKRIEVYANGTLTKTFVLPVCVKAYKNVLVARNFIDRESSITNLNTRVERKEISTNIQNIITSDKLKKDMMSKKFFKEGELIDKRFVKMRPDVTRNQEVSAVFESNKIMISISATSLSDGMIGDYVILQSPRYNKNYRGKVIGRNRVLISI